jgi:hypothetical protein
VADLHRLIDEWKRAHPGQYYVAYTRFSDFDAYRNLTPESPEAKAPGSLFSVFYVDPLAGLDPVAKELRSYRALTERIAYIASRMPVVAAYEVDFAVNNATGNPAIQTFVASTAKFADSTDRFARAAADYPRALATERDAAVKQLAESLAKERQAAIEQSAKAVAAERQAIVGQLEQQDGKVRAIVGDVTRLVERAEQAGTSINSATAQTVTTTEESTRRIMNQAFRLALALLVAVLLGVPVSMLAYRVARRRVGDVAPAHEPART